MSNLPDSFAALMAFWPTLADLAADLGCPVGTVLSWSRRGVIPRSRWPDLLVAAARRRYRITEARLEVAARLPRQKSNRIDVKRSRFTRPPGGAPRGA